MNAVENFAKWLNQAHAWFLEIAFVLEVGKCVCLSLSLCVYVCPPPGYLKVLFT